MLSENATLQSINLTNSLQNFGVSTLKDELTSDGLTCKAFGASTKSVLNWIKEGSVCEDDTFTEIFARYKHHFYDFQHNGKGFGGILKRNSGLISGKPAPDWVLDMGPADGQLYSFSQGRQYFYNALTATSEAERKANLARMFRTLGDVMHIMQDMAQPQHTRNDSHGLPSSWYEVYTDKQREKNSLIYGGATVTTFATAREYFTDLAKFSSTNFVSAGTNFDEAAQLGYDLPVAGTPTDVPVHILVPAVSPEILAKCDPSKPCIMTFYPTNQTVKNERASALSIFDQYLGQKTVTYTEPVTSTTYTTKRVFRLNSYTFDTALPILIPRAVAYSAGILDYFFRGQIDMVSDPGNPGKYMIKNTGTEDMTGNFALYYDAVDGNRYPVPGAAWSNLPVSANSQANNLSFVPPDNPAPKTPDEYTLVFSGTMGAEQAGHDSLGVANSSIGAVVAKKVGLQTVVGYAVLTGNSATHAFSYSGGVMTDLGTLGGYYSYAYGINVVGTVVGVSYLAGGSLHAFSYSQGAMIDLGTLGGSYSFATGINDFGTIVGYSITGTGVAHVFSYSNGVMTDLGTLGGTNSYAFGINAAGAIVGSSYLAGGAEHAFSYSNGVMTDLGTLGGKYSRALGINTAGIIVGGSDLASGAEHAFRYSNGVMTDLGTLGGNFSRATGINSTGTIVGFSSIPGGAAGHAFSYSGGVMTDLGTLGGTNSQANGINSAGTIVGESQTGDGAWHAFSYSGGKMTDLGTLGGYSSWANGIK